jgi:2-desacetyl-2-hydroxyethyl bacteriochlorophyllide A dehydrogenase
VLTTNHFRIASDELSGVFQTKAVVFTEPGKSLRVEDVELPVVTDNDVLVRVKAAGICRSDLHTIHGHIRPGKTPIILGHEGAGVIARKGKLVTDFSEDDPVVVDYVLSCGNCEYCNVGKHNLCDRINFYGFRLDGTWAEYMAVPATNVFRLPKNVPFDQGALAGCAVVTGYHAMKVSEMTAGNSVAVIGLGGVGSQLLQWCKLFGATDIIGIDVDDYKLKLARELGATATVNARQQNFVETVSELTDGRGVDIGFEAIGSKDANEKLLSIIKKSGKAVIVGMCFDKISVTPVDLMYKEMQIRSPTEHTKSEMREVLRFLGRGAFDVSKTITKRIPIDKANEGIEMLEKETEKQVRIILEP